MIGDPAVRNRGTIGGNLAHSDPASDLPTVLTALGATINITRPGRVEERVRQRVHPRADGEQPRLGRDHHEHRRPREGSEPRCGVREALASGVPVRRRGRLPPLSR